MKKYAKTLVAIAFLLGFTSVVKAESQDGVIVDMPFEFVVGATTLPAGTYTVHNLADDTSGTLVIRSKEQGTAMFVLPYASESTETFKPELSLDKVGDHYFLNTIRTAETVYRIHVSRSALKETAAKSGGSAPTSVIVGGR